MRSLDELKKLLQNKQSVVILPHTKPDADALGSCLALAGILKKDGHDVHVISPTDYPAFLNWIVGQDDVIQLDESNKTEVEEIIAKADVIFNLDYCALNRIDDLEPMVRNASAQLVLIDHHIGKEDFADFEMWSTSASSTAELIWDFINNMDYRHLMDHDIAEAIYAGIMTDTGSFRFPSTTKKVHLILGELMDYDIDNAKVHRLVYDNNRYEKLQFLGYALSEKLNYLPEFNTAYISLSQKELDNFDYQTGDSEGLVNYALSLKNVVFSALIIEKDGMIKFSFRSIGDFNVNEYARKHFNGGGHKNAAGGRLNSSIEKAISTFEGTLKEYQKDLIKQSELVNSLC